ncbi:MAG: hypothetical protein HGA19_06575 [Oscillochloris sp.]|nr:hypothetical protein [Oscillochloris sp.]
MYDQPFLHCANCGTILEMPHEDTLGITCPVCQFFNPLTVSSMEPSLTLETFETMLGDLVTQARASEISLSDIVNVLRDELEFAAELANDGRDLYVQIMDLGPRVGQPMRRSSKNESVLLRGRIVGG